MTAKELLAKLTQAGCQARLDGEQIKVSGPLNDELRGLIRKHKAELVLELQRQQETSPFGSMFEKAVAAISKK